MSDYEFIAKACNCNEVDLPDYSDLNIIRAAVIQVFNTSDKLNYFCDKLKVELCMSGLWPTFDVPDFILIKAESRHYIRAFIAAYPYILNKK